MKQTQSLYKYLYQMLTSQILNGTFIQGQKFPSQHEICLQYNVGITTVRKVMKMLDEQGYIHTAQGQPSVVTYQAPKEIYATLLVQRREEIADAYQGLGLLMPVLYREGAKQCKEPELRFFHKILENISEQMELEDHYRQANAFFTTLLRPLKNQLIMDLELDSENYLHVPYIPFPDVENPFATTVERTKIWLKTAIYQIEQKQFDDFCDGSARLYSASNERVDRYLCALSKYTSHVPQTKVDINWFRVKERSELYSRLAMTIIRRIVSGEFDGKKYLPSIPELMDEYGVMKNTARRAVALLNSLGFVQTIDKKGTVILIQEKFQTNNNFSLTESVIQERLSLFLDAFQIVTLIAHNCASSFSSIPKELVSSFENRLLTAPDNKFIALSFQLLMNCFIQLTPCHSLKNILRQLDDLIIWGHYLQAIDKSYYENRDYSEIVTAMKAVITALKNQSNNELPNAFSKAFLLLYQELCAVVSYLPYDF